MYIALAIILLLVFVVLGLWIVIPRMPKSARALRVFSQEIEAEFIYSKNPKTAKVQFESDGEPVQIRLKPPVGFSGVEMTEYRTSWPNQFRMQLHEQSLTTPDLFYDESDPMLTGDAEFDEIFRLYADDQKQAKLFLDPTSRRLIRNLLTEPERGSIFIEIHDGQFYILKQHVFKFEQSLHRFAKDCQALRVQGMAASKKQSFAKKEAGSVAEVPTPSQTAKETTATKTKPEMAVEEQTTEITEEPVKPVFKLPPQGSICPACGEIVADPIVACQVCSGQYHKNCWDKKKGCVIYACDGTDYMKVSKNAPYIG
ncbi:MAG: RING finger protein [Pirellulales bacterium]